MFPEQIKRISVCEWHATKVLESPMTNLVFKRHTKTARCTLVNQTIVFRQNSGMF